MAYCNIGKICITMKKTSQLTTQIDVDAKEDFDFAAALESVYPLLEIVFSHLDFDDLRTVSEVKTSWKYTADRVLQKRNELSWITVFRKKRQSWVHNSLNYSYSNKTVGIISFNFNQLSPSDTFCLHENGSRKTIKFADFLSQQLVPSGVNYCVLGSHVVSSMFSNKITRTSTVSLFDCCFLPNIPNIRISMFFCNSKSQRDDHVHANERVKCLLVFCKRDLGSAIYSLLRNMLKPEELTRTAVGGGIVRRLAVFPQQDKPSRNNLCILLTEDIFCESMCDTYSIVMRSFQTEKFTAKLTKFKNQIVIRNQSIAFKISCAAKKQKKLELEIFNKVFPNTPFLGIEVEGEIGLDCFNKLDVSDALNGDEGAKRPKMSRPTVQHQFSTVIVFITWGEKIYK